MDNSERNEHFKSFAKLLWDELVELNKGGYIDVSSYFDDGIDPTNYRLLIAQRAYDLACHVTKGTENAIGIIYDIPSVTDIVRDIPDLTEWPTPPEP